MGKYIYELSTISWQEGILGLFSSPVKARAEAHRQRKGHGGKYKNGQGENIWRIKRVPVNEALSIHSISSINGEYNPDTDEIDWGKSFRITVEP